MTSFTEYLNQGNAWLYIPGAIMLGALHGFEPGHSKTMMAAFIIAVRGTVWQAVLLGLSATLSHTAIIWILAAIGLHFSGKINVEELEPYFEVATGLIIIGMAYWIFRRTKKEQREAEVFQAHSHVHSPTHDDADRDHAHAEPSSLLVTPGMAAPHPHSHGHGPHGGMMLDTGHGFLEVSVFETEVPPRFRIHPCKASGQVIPLPKGTTVSVETARLDGSSQKFSFTAEDGYWESTAVLPEPHEFLAIVTMSHGDHAHTYKLRFTEDNHHAGLEGLEPESQEYQDAHEKAHAEELKARFATRSVTTWQIVLFGLTGGLMPCPAAFTILLICLQLKQFALGMGLVLAFSIGLALTLVSVGALAALSMREASKRFKGFGELARKLPYASSAVMGLIGLMIAVQGFRGIFLH